MLSVKPWKPDAIVRLVASVFVCIYGGSLAVLVLRYAGSAGSGPGRFYAVTGAAFVCLALTLFQLRQAWHVENMMKRLGLLLGCFYAALILGTWAHKLSGVTMGPSVAQLLVAALSFQGAALVLMGRFLREHSIGWREAFGLSNGVAGALLRGVIVACAFLPVAIALQWVSARLMVHVPYLHLKPEEQEAVQTLQLAVSWQDRLALGFVTILLVPPAEEMLFRGVLYPGIKQAGFPRAALWGTSLVFAAVHLNMVSFIPLLVFALILVTLYEWTDNLLAPVSAHATFNGLNFFMLYLVQESAAKAQ